MAKQSPQAPADKAPPEVKPLSGKGSSPESAGATEPSEEPGVVPVSASEGPGPQRKKLQDNFNEANALITKSILGEVPSEQEVDMVKAFRVSQTVLEQYVTLDWQHYEDIDRLMKGIREYAGDRSRRRPLNIVMQAEPGSGKSHFIKCLAQRMSKDRLSDITFNMASLQSLEDFIQPLEAVRNLKVIDKLPLLFLDEFDSDEGNYAPLLPLLWDGELNIGHRQLRIGKVVIVLAGSGARIEETMKRAKGMQPAAVSGDGKLTDLLSRINGGELRIPGLDEMTSSRNRRVDKVCVTLSLLQRRFGTRLGVAPWAFLRFVADTKFKYGVRSITHLIDLIPSSESVTDRLVVKDLRLPLGSVAALESSSLAYHLVAESGPSAIVEAWKNLNSKDIAVKFDRPRMSLLEVLLKYSRSRRGGKSSA